MKKNETLKIQEENFFIKSNIQKKIININDLKMNETEYSINNEIENDGRKSVIKIINNKYFI